MVALIIQMKCYVIPEIWLKSILMLFRYIQGTASSYSAFVPNQPLQLRGNSYKRNNHNSLPTICFSLLLLERGGSSAELWNREMVFLHKPNKGQFDPESDAWFGKISHATGELSPAPQLLSLCSRVWERQLLQPECRRACAQEKPL